MEQTFPLMARGQNQTQDTERPRYRLGIMVKAGNQTHSNFNIGGHKRHVFYPDLLCSLGRYVCVKEREGMNFWLRFEWSNSF